jgi:hypothetical protein
MMDDRTPDQIPAEIATKRALRSAPNWIFSSGVRTTSITTSPAYRSDMDSGCRLASPSRVAARGLRKSFRSTWRG